MNPVAVTLALAEAAGWVVIGANIPRTRVQNLRFGLLRRDVDGVATVQCGHGDPYGSFAPWESLDDVAELERAFGFGAVVRRHLDGRYSAVVRNPSRHYAIESTEALARFLALARAVLGDEIQ